MSAVDEVPIASLPLWEVMRQKRMPVSFDLEITTRCNNDCGHCYINTPAGDRRALRAELTVEEIDGLSGFGLPEVRQRQNRAAIEILGLHGMGRKRVLESLVEVLLQQ